MCARVKANVTAADLTWLKTAQPDVLGALGLQPVLLSVVGEVVADSPASVAGQTGDWVTV